MRVLSFADSAEPNALPTITGTNWTNPDSAKSSDDKRTSYNNTAQNWLICTGFGFSIPAGATVDGFSVSVEGYSDQSTISRRVINTGIVIGGSQSGNANTDTLPQTTEAAHITPQSGPESDLWGTSNVTPATVNASDFGCCVRDNNATAHIFYIDQVTMTVYYTQAFGIFRRCRTIKQIIQGR